MEEVSWDGLKKEINPNIHENPVKKKKNRKNKKNMLTSMTTHVKKVGIADQY